MNRLGRLATTAFAVFLGLGSSLALAAQPEPRQVFPRRARIDSAGGAVERAVLPPRVLAEARADLADLRIVTESGRFVPFAVVPATDPRRDESVARSRPVRLEAVDRAVDRKGEARAERLVLTPVEPDFGFDRIVFELPGSELLVARVSVADVAEDGSRTSLAMDAPLFRLPRHGGGLASQRVAIDVPRTTSARLEVEIGIEQGSWISPGTVFLERSDTPRPEVGEVGLELRATTSDDLHTVLDLARPAGIAPHRLRFETATGAFVREVRVRDVGGNPLGRGVIARRPSGDFSALTVNLDRSPSDDADLYVEIDDAGEGALDEVTVFAGLALPSIVFTPYPDEVSHLYWGGGRVTTASHRPLGSFEGDAQVVTLAAPQANPFYKDEPAMGFAERAGPALDTSAWSHERALMLDGAPEGLVQWIPQAEDLALLRDDFADLRIVDGEDRQIAYLLADAPALTVQAQLESVKAEAHTSRWKLWASTAGAPAAAIDPISIAALDLTFSDVFFSRRMRVLGSWPRHSDALVGETQAERRDRAGETHIDLPGSPRLASVILEVEDGDDPPLSLAHASFQVPTQRVLFAAPPGRYRALLGQANATAPHYELEEARDLALSLATGEVVSGALGPNQRYRKPSVFSAPDGGSMALWIALIVSVLVLVGFTLKLAREPSAPEPPASS